MVNRRNLLKIGLFAGLGATQLDALAHMSDDAWLSVIDLDRCDGCTDLAIPACVLGCREKNQSRFPQPQKPLMPYWPQTHYEDYSEQQEVTSRLTPYNWLYVERVSLNGQNVFIPRRCMHCADASCQKLCPFGTIEQKATGAVIINHDYCFGGAKCRDVCPWGIPQRQAGVGLYLDLAPKFAGGGLMYKCDFCQDRLEKNTLPACSQACPQKAMIFAKKKTLMPLLTELARDRHLYGLTENGGTSTIYVSRHRFEDLHQAILAKYDQKALPGRPGLPTAESRFEEQSAAVTTTLAAPVVSLGAATAAAWLAKRKKNQGGAP